MELAFVQNGQETDALDVLDKQDCFSRTNPYKFVKVGLGFELQNALDVREVDTTQLL